MIKRLNKIQQTLKAPKNQYNDFGKYNYRSCEDILEAIKPLLEEDEIVTLSDTVESVGNRNYIVATATFYKGENKISVTGQAREAETKKGMDDAQITGSASSYARKYALNGLFCIDDTKDSDTNEAQKSTQAPYKQETQKSVSKPLMTEEQFKFAIKYLVDKKIIKIGTSQDIVMKHLEAQHEVPPKFMFLIEEEIAKASL